MLRVRLIGGLALELDGDGLELPRSRRGRALLAWLALHPGDHARGSVAARFWPDVLEESARASLRAALTELRGALGPAASFLTATRETVGLAGDERELWIDVRAFDALLDAGELAKAAEIGAGELLRGVDDEWALEARSEHDRRLLDALEAMAAEAERAGDLADAVRHSRSAAALDPLDEQAGRRLIARLARAGESSRALAVYESLAARLRSALAVAPSAATRKLVEEIRASAHGATAAGSVPIPAVLERRYDRPFIGRARELERLRAAWSGVQLHGARRLVLVAGEPGVGKTRLAFEFARKAGTRDALVLIGRCGEEPLGSCDPVLTALRDVGAALGPGAGESRAGPSPEDVGRGLERAESGQLIETWLGPERGQEVAGEIHERPAGNAFFLEEVLRGFDEDAHAGLPEGIRQAVGARLERLSDSASDLLAV